VESDIAYRHAKKAVVSYANGHGINGQPAGLTLDQNAIVWAAGRD